MHPTIHQKLTRIAIDKYKNDLPKEITEQFKEQIIKGTKAEDDWFMPSRTWNWHFYRQNERIVKKTSFWKMNPTSEVIFEKHIKKMQTYPMNDPKRYKCLGRILHHIQDMNTPSHVTPIYHDPFTKDYFESFMIDALKDERFKPEIPNETMTLDKDFLSIYEDAAKKTLNLITATKIKVTKDNQTIYLPLSIFWKDHTEEEDPKRPGFGLFGEPHKVFSEEGDNRMFELDNNKYDISLDELHRLNNIFCGKAIRDTFRALKYVASL